MTRDEAVGIVRSSYVHSTSYGAQLVDALAALSLLKLDEQKEPHEILAHELGWGAGSTRTLKDTLVRAGLKVVRA
jgi:hypothetical protein